MSAQHRSMDDPFSEQLHAWLDDPEAKTTGEPSSPVAAGYAVTKRAIAEADSHETCGKDARTYTVLIGVAGADGQETVHEITPETTLMCVLGALARDPETAGMRVIGILADDDEDPPDGVVVTSENPDIEVTWSPVADEPAPRPPMLAPLAHAPLDISRPRALPKPRHLRRSRWSRVRSWLGIEDDAPLPGEDTPAPPDEVGPFDIDQEGEAA